MPSPPPHSPTVAAAALFLILLQLFTVPAAETNTCSNPESAARSPCPPFTSPPPFPFSFLTGCGHPSFQIQCSSRRSFITINNLSFSLIRYQTNSSSLLLSPQPSASSSDANCSSNLLSLPNLSINLSNSPFRVSDASCSRLSVLKPCPPLNLPNCSRCPWDCKLIKSPVQLFHECGSGHRLLSKQGCHGDVLGFLDKFLSLGIEVEWDEDRDTYFSDCKVCEANDGVCGFNSSDPKKQFLCFRSLTEMPQARVRQHGPSRLAILCIIFVFMCLLAVITTASVIFRSKRKSLPAEEDPTMLYLRRHRSASLLPPVFTYEELESSTNRFDPKRKIGDGGFGSVFLGQLQDGRIVAVKHLHRHHPSVNSGAQAFSAKSFCNEILILSSINHPNLVKLHGYCSDPRGLLLVYDYVPNGTLAEHLHGTQRLYRKGSLTWPVRVDIALQIATAIEYLHFSVVPPIVHRDITSSNIFVEKDMRIKVGDFGLSRLLVLPETNSASTTASSGCVWTGPQGTPGYLDPDYHRSFRLTEKSDVYSFGVVLLELITGMKAVDQRRDKREVALADLVVSKIHMGLLHQVVDPVLVVDSGREAMDGVGSVAELAFQCVAADKDDRPDATEVVAELRRIRSRTRGGCGGGGNGVLRTASNSMNVVVPEEGV